MSNIERFIEIDGQQIPVNEDVYRAYKRPLWTERKRKERSTRCRDVKGNRCIKDCKTCPKVREGGVVSLNQLNDAGYEASDPINMEELIADKLLFEQLYAALDKLTIEENELIADLFFQAKSERDVADRLGLSQKAVNKRRHRTLEKLRGLMHGKLPAQFGTQPSSHCPLDGEGQKPSERR